MGYEQLIASLVSEAGAERDRILKDAAEKADKIVSDARWQIDEYRRGPMGLTEVRLSGEKARRMHTARLDAEAQLNGAKRKIIQRTVERAEKFLEKQLLGDGGRSSLRALLEEAVEGLREGTIHVAPALAGAIKEMIDNLDGSFEVQTSADLSPGLKVIKSDGLMEVDNTLPVRLERYMTVHESEVARLLFNGEESA